jgi:nucleoside-triphosphatase THEP1
MTAIAAILGRDSTAAQSLLAALVARWQAAGTKVVGVIDEGHGIPDRTCRAGTLRDIVSGKRFPIFFETAPSDTSCLIDVPGVEAAAEALLPQISASDLVVLSKFGKVEATGRGLSAVFEAAIASEKPVLTAVSQKHRDAWQAFAPGATVLAPDEAAIEAWWRSATNRR